MSSDVDKYHPYRLTARFKFSNLSYPMGASLSDILFSFVLEKYIVCDVCGLRSPSFVSNSVLNISPTDTSSIQNWFYKECTMASQITSTTVVYSIVYLGADLRKHQSSASLAFVRGIHLDRWIPRTNGQQRGKCFHLMTSSINHKSVNAGDSNGKHQKQP